MFFKVIYQITIIFTLLGLGAFARYKNFFTQETIQDLAKINLTFLLPCLMFHSIVTQLNLQELKISWPLALLGTINVIVPSIIGWIVSTCASITDIKKRSFIYLTTFSNFNFLAVPLTYALFGSKGLALLFLHNFGYTCLYWTYGIWLLKGKKDSDLFKHLFNPTLLAIAASLIITSLNWNTRVPGFFLDITALLGRCAIPMIMLTVGAILGKLNLQHYFFKKEILLLIPARLLIVPVSVFFILYWFHVPVVLCNIAMVVAAMPSASNSPVIMSLYGGDRNMAVAGVFFTTLIGLLTIPLMLWLFIR